MAKTDLETLVISLEANIKSYEKALDKARDGTNKRLREIEERAAKSGGGVGKGLADGMRQAETQAARSGAAISAVLSSSLKGIGAAVVTNEIRKMADAWQEATNKIKASGASSTALDQIVDIAQRARAELAPTVDLYARLTRSSAELGASQAEVAVATETVAKALKISGASGQEASSTLIQLSQGLQSGRLQGDELRSLLENAPVLVQSIAKEFGVAVGELKTLGAEGKLVSDRVFKALVNSAAEVNTAFAKTAPTVADAMTNLGTAATQYVGHSSAVAAATSLVIGGIEGLTNNFSALGNGALALGAILATRLVAAGLGPLAVQIGLVAAQFATATPSIAATNTVLAATAGRAGAAAVAARALSGALALIGGVPGAIILGVGAAALYAAGQMKTGEEEAKRYAAALDRVREKGEGAGKEVKATGDAVILAARKQQAATLADIKEQEGAAKRAADEARKGLDDAQNQMQTVATMPMTSALSASAEKAGELVDQFKNGLITIDQFELGMLDIGRTGLALQKPIDKAKALAATLAGATARLKELNGERDKASGLEADGRESAFKMETDRQGRIVGSTPEFRSLREASFENAHLEEAQKSAEAKELDAEAQRILNEAKKKGVEYTQDQADALAKQAVAARKAVEAAKDLEKKSLKEVIRHAEGTASASGYNTSLGYGRYLPGGKEQNLTAMTLDQVYALGEYMKAQPGNPNSSALGAYQIVNTTRRRLQNKLGMKGSDLYDVANQERMAEELIRERGNSVTGLRNEWQGLTKVGADTITNAYLGSSSSMPAVDQSVTEKNKALEDQKKAYAEINAEAERYVARQQIEAQAVGMTDQQAEALRHTQELLNEAQRAGIEITPTLAQHYQQLGERMAAADANVEGTRKKFEELNDTAAFFGGEAVDALSGLVTGTTTAQQALQSLVQTLVRATLQAALLGEGPLASLFGGNGGGLTKGIGSALGSLFGGGSGAGAGFTGTGVYHNGGLVGAGGASRTVPAALFAGAPRYHNGGVAGLKPDEIPAILQRGEYVVSKAHMAAAAVASRGGGGAAPTVNVINNGPTQPEVQASRSGDGWSIDVMIPALENAMAARAGRGHGSLGKAVTSTATGRNLRG